MRRHRTSVIAVSAVALSIIAGLVATGVLLVRERAVAAEREQAVLRQQAETARKEQARDASRALIDLANERLSQGRTADGLAYLISAARQDPTNPTIAPRLSSLLTARNFLLPQGTVVEHASPVLAANYSDDGQRLVTVWEDGTFARIDLVSGRVEKTRLSTTARNTYGQMATPNFLLIYGTDGLIYCIDRQTGQLSSRIRFDNDPMGCRAVDNVTDLFFTKLTSNTMMVADARAGRMIGQPIPYDPFIVVGPHWSAWLDDPAGKISRKVHLRRNDPPFAITTLEFPMPITRGGLATSPDGKMLATVQREGPENAFRFRLWTLPEGRSVGKPHLLARYAHPFFSPDGKFALCWGEGIDVFEVQAPAHVAGMPSAGVFVDAQRHVFSPDGRTLVTWGNPGLVDLWEIATGAPRTPPLRHGGNVTNAMFSRDGGTLMTSGEADARIWSARTGELLAEPTMQLVGRSIIALSPDGAQLIIGTGEGAVQRVRIGTAGARALIFETPNGMPMQFSRGVPTHVLQVAEEQTRALDIASNREVPGGFAHPEPVKTAALRRDGKVAVVQTQGGRWRAWWHGNGRVERSFDLEAAPAEFANVIFSDRLDRVALANGLMLRVWDLNTGKPTGPSIPGASNFTWSRFSSFSPDARRIVQGSNQGQARIWDVETGRGVVDFAIQPTPILRAMYSPDGTLIASGNRRVLTRLWDANTGRPVGPAVFHRGEYTEGVFSPDSEVVASYSADAKVYLQRKTSKWQVAQALETAGAIWMVRFNRDGSRLATTTRDGTAQVWDVASGVQICEPLRHGAVRVIDAEFSDDDRFLRTETSPNGKYFVWSLPPALPKNSSTPEWLLELATVLADKSVKDSGVSDLTSNARLDRVRKTVADLPADEAYGEWAKWFLTEPAKRSIAPGFTVFSSERR